MSKEGFTPLNLFLQLMNPKPTSEIMLPFNLVPEQIIARTYQIVKVHFTGENPLLECFHYSKIWQPLSSEEVEQKIKEHIGTAIYIGSLKDVSRSFLGVDIRTHSPLHQVLSLYYWLVDINARTGINLGDGNPVEREDKSVSMTQTPLSQENNSHLFIRQRKNNL